MQTAPKSFKKGYKFRFYPTESQKQHLRELFGANRFTYNRLLERSQKAYEVYKADVAITNEAPKPGVSGYDFCAQLPTLKEEFPWLKDYSSVSLQQTCLHLGKAFSGFFKAKRGGYPKFKSKWSKQSISLTALGFRVKEGKLHLAKIKEPFAPVWSRKLPSAPSSLVITLTPSGEYYVSFVCEYTPPKTAGKGSVGIDLGLTHLATLSDGTRIDNPRHYQRAQRKLRRLQQSLARKKKGSKNRIKARLRVARCHAHVAAQRTDHLHKLTRRLVNDSQVIGIEQLVVENMVKNRRLAKHIQSVAWATLTRQLAYKSAESQYCQLVMMDRFFPSSHVCASTGMHLGRKLGLGERSWQCPHCGEVHDRDVNAAENIASEALYQVQLHGWDRRPHDGKVMIASKYERRL